MTKNISKKVTFVISIFIENLNIDTVFKIK